MSQEYSQRQLERMVQGPEENPNVMFYEQSKMNPDLSRAAGKRVYQTRIMIKKTQPGLADFAAYVAQPADIKEWPKEFAYFENTKADVGSPSIDILPGITPDIIQELKDYGLVTITKLCAAQTLPEHLLYAQASARRLNEALHHEQEENTGEEVLTPDRPVDPVGIRRRVIPEGIGAEVRAATEGLRESGRIDSGQGRDREEVVKDSPRPSAKKRQEVNGWDNPNWNISIGG